MAVKESKKDLDRRAGKCIIIAKQTLPKADDETLENLAAEFMYLPETSMNLILKIIKLKRKI